MVTGESKLVEMWQRDEVIGGTVNGDGSITVETRKTGDETYLSQVVRNVPAEKSSLPGHWWMSGQARPGRVMECPRCGFETPFTERDLEDLRESAQRVNWQKV